MKISNLFAAVLLMAAAYLGQAHQFETCAEDKLGIQHITINPDPILAGKKLRVDFNGIAKQDLHGGKAKLEVTVLDISVYSHTFDLCKDMNVTCPVSKGRPFDATVLRDIPSEAPKLDNVNVKVEVEDENGHRLSCIKMKITVHPHASGDFIDWDYDSGANVYDPSATSLRPNKKEVDFLFSSWARQYDMYFPTLDELERRMRNFEKNHYMIQHHNRREDVTFKLGHNQFSHMSRSEIKEYLGLRPVSEKDLYASSAPRYPQSIHDDADLERDLPEEVDWVKAGAVTNVKNQGRCGSCWAFSTTGSTEGSYKLTTGKLISFAEQQLVDCDLNDHACGGGLMDNAFSWIITHKGFCREEDYPYTAHRGQCAVEKCDIVPGSHIVNYTDVTPGSEAAMRAAVAKQPVSIAVEADTQEFMFYSSGIFTAECGTNLDHGILIVGYGERDGVSYWKVKNSWDTTWGEDGYMYMQRGKHQDGGQCGILLAGSYPQVAGT